ncbi:hypothetical protein EQZ20_24600 (plasmid) [Bacillus glycinifermentans]|uniref:Uncharacterized protein n=1 Tax=Bacillus glycinifermentans TaxID=1664069 RepID=A0AAJ3Z356_9BACI|nr:hypothetical protein [Bacillus glycinifermentans]QAT68056.1 hypothetical protein EQZ20_24600 [Bacillus glycinifermentans]
MVNDVVSLITYLIRAVQAIAGSYAALKLSTYAIGYMTKNHQRIEEAKGGMKNVAIGIIIVAGCEAIIQWLQKGIHF